MARFEVTLHEEDSIYDVVFVNANTKHEALHAAVHDIPAKSMLKIVDAAVEEVEEDVFDGEYYQDYLDNND